MAKHVLVFEKWQGQLDEAGDYSVSQRYQFDNYAEIDSYNFLKKIKIKPANKDLEHIDSLGLANFVKEIEYSKVNTVTIEYGMEPLLDRIGIDGVNLNLKRVIISGYYEIWDSQREESDEHEFEYVDEGPFNNRLQVEWDKLPFHPSRIEIDVNAAPDDVAIDLTKVSYKIYIGESY